MSLTTRLLSVHAVCLAIILGGADTSVYVVRLFN